jgi:hypothetical protein
VAGGFLLGTGQTLVDTAQQSIVPALVSRDPARLERANGRLQGTQIVANQLVGRRRAGSCSRWRRGSRWRSTPSPSGQARR